MSKFRYFPKDKTDTLYGECSNEDVNTLGNELINTILSANMTPSMNENDQLAKSIANYVAKGNFYADTTTDYSHIILTAQGNFKAPNIYYDGMMVSFLPNGNNNANATINVNGLGEKSIRSSVTASSVSYGEIKQGKYTQLVYNSNLNSFIMLISDTTFNADTSLTNLTVVGNRKTFAAQNLENNIDFNTLVERGCYYIPNYIPGTATPATQVNGPDAGPGTLIVQNGDMNDTNYVQQEFTTVIGGAKIFRRTRTAGNWSAWYRMIINGGYNYSAGVSLPQNAVYTPQMDGIIIGIVSPEPNTDKSIGLFMGTTVNEANRLAGISRPHGTNGIYNNFAVPVYQGQSYYIDGANATKITFYPVLYY